MRRASRVRRRMKLAIEVLEDRAVPTTFGVPWSDARNLTLSFAPDGAGMARESAASAIYATLDEQTRVMVRECGPPRRRQLAVEILTTDFFLRHFDCPQLGGPHSRAMTVEFMKFTLPAVFRPAAAPATLPGRIP